VVCLSECDCEASIMRRPWSTESCWAISNIITITVLLFDNHLPEDGHCRPKHVGGVSIFINYSIFYCCAVVGINSVNMNNINYS
jgi:hypothetical protein